MPEFLKRNAGVIWTILAVIGTNYVTYVKSQARTDEQLLNINEKLLSHSRILESHALHIEKINSEGSTKAKSEWGAANNNIVEVQRRLNNMEDYIYRTVGPTLKSIETTVTRMEKTK